MAEEQTDNPKDDKIPYDMRIFSVWANSIQRQIDQTNEQINDCAARIHELEPELDNTTSASQLPDSNGFWSDKDGDIWSYDGDPDNPPRFIFSTAFQEICETPTDITATWAALEDCAPFTKISNPFTTGDNHADR